MFGLFIFIIILYDLMYFNVLGKVLLANGEFDTYLIIFYT